MPILRCPYLMSIPVVYSLLSKPRCQFLLSNPCCQCQDVIPCCPTRCKYKDVFTMLTEPRCHGSLSFWCKTWCKNRRKKALCPRTKRLRFRYYSLFMLSISNIIPFVNRKSENFQKIWKISKSFIPLFPLRNCSVTDCSHHTFFHTGCMPSHFV